MKVSFSIDRDIKRAVYRQIMSGIASMVRDGQLTPGDKLPSERELANMLGTSRGTVKKAYDELCTNGMLQCTIGSGTFISMEQNVVDTKSKHEALDSIENLARNLIQLGFSYREIETHFNLVINKYKTQSKLVKIATIDCSPEALYTFEDQLNYISQIKIDKILLDDLRAHPSPLSLVSEYDLILTTSTHYDEICSLVSNVSQKIMRAVLSPDRQTVIELAQILKDKQVGAICLSHRYLKVILKFMTRDILEKNTLLINKNNIDIEKFLSDKDYLILPPSAVVENTDMLNLDDFITGGGQVIYFNYQIERGALIYIEERISSILQQKLRGLYE